MLDHPRYEAVELLGEGAQGRVVRVIDRERPNAKLVAKILRSSAPEHRLAGEFALLARLHIPGLVRVHGRACGLAASERSAQFFPLRVASTGKMPSTPSLIARPCFSSQNPMQS